MSGPPTRAEAVRITFIVIFLGGLMATAFLVVRPFLAPLLWATMVVVATWPVLLRVQRLLWNRRSLAMIVVTLLLLLLFLIPLMLALLTILSHANQFESWAHNLASYHVTAPLPTWIGNLPVVGGPLQTAWQQSADVGVDELLPKAAPYVSVVARWIVMQIGGISFLLVQSLATVAISAVLYLYGESAGQMVRGFAARLAGERGTSVIDIATGAIRGVALGVGGTALIQASIGGVGLVICGVPDAALLTALMFMLCIAQIGPLPVLVPASIWLFWSGQTSLGSFLVVVSVVVWALETALRPMLIRKGANLPLLLIFAGVIGGLLSFGLVGIFVGPLALAITFTLFNAWTEEVDKAANPIPMETY